MHCAVQQRLQVQRGSRSRRFLKFHRRSKSKQSIGDPKRKRFEPERSRCHPQQRPHLFLKEAASVPDGRPVSPGIVLVQMLVGRLPIFC